MTKVAGRVILGVFCQNFSLLRCLALFFWAPLHYNSMKYLPLCRKLWQMLKKAEKSPLGIFIAIKVFTCFSNLSEIGIVNTS